MKKNLLNASLIAAAIALWLLSGLLRDTPPATQTLANRSATAPAAARTRVRVREFQAEQRTLTTVLRGKTDSKRSARVSAETAGRVINRPVERGARVAAGELLCELAVNEREAALEQARADLARAELEYRGATELKDKGLLSDIRIAQVAAERSAARTALRVRELDLARTRITAPFDGIVETLHVDVGDFAAVGTPCATVLDLDPLLITANVSERIVERLSLGDAVTARTSTDQRLEGVLSFIGSQSDPTTRTYPIEVTVPNPDYHLRAGLTTVASVETETVLAHRVSPGLFTLNDRGEMGLRAVDRDNRVVFHRVQVVEDAADGTWVTGLPGDVRLITVGQEFVSGGQRVDVQDEGTAPATAALP
jgi:multidrug efflux system membrane fusion protein